MIARNATTGVVGRDRALAPGVLGEGPASVTARDADMCLRLYGEGLTTAAGQTAARSFSMLASPFVIGAFCACA